MEKVLMQFYFLIMFAWWVAGCMRDALFVVRVNMCPMIWFKCDVGLRQADQLFLICLF